MTGNGVFVILNPLAESVFQSSEPAHRHAHGKVFPLSEAGQKVREVMLSTDRVFLRPSAHGRVVAASGTFLALGPIDIDLHGVVNVRSESIFDR